MTVGAAMRLVRPALVVAVVAACLAGCGGSPEGQTAAAQETGGVRCTVRLDPPVPAAMRQFRLGIEFTDNAGRPVRVRDAKADLTMPGMSMAPNRPELSRDAPGTFSAHAVLAMSGDWLLTVAAKRGDRTLRFPFPVQAR